jgi:hypothetical protein
MKIGSILHNGWKYGWRLTTISTIKLVRWKLDPYYTMDENMDGG